MSLRAVLLFKEGLSVEAAGGEPDERFKSLTTEGVEGLKRMAREYLLKYDIIRAVSAPNPICLDSLNCLLLHADIALIPEYEINPLLDPGEKLNEWRNTIGVAKENSEKRLAGKICPETLLQANPELVLSTGETVYNFIRHTGRNLRNRTVAVMVSRAGMIESILCWLVQKVNRRGQVFIDNLLQAGEGLIFKFDTERLGSYWSVGFLPAVPEISPETEALHRAIRSWARKYA